MMMMFRKVAFTFASSTLRASASVRFLIKMVMVICIF